MLTPTRDCDLRTELSLPPELGPPELGPAEPDRKLSAVDNLSLCQDDNRVSARALLV